ncbi:MAG TPA: hypothetical protein DCQ64_16645 [Candidatus Rokubacteria bacterium]|nr:hypothetical protein [Candidatus Rokubacteria bacterium]
MKVKSVRLAKPMARDSRFVLALRNRPEVRAASANTAVITILEHAHWWCTRGNGELWIVMADHRRAGYVRRCSFGYVSIALSPWARGRKVASRALRALRRRHPDGRLVARIRADNWPSIKLFGDCGYERTWVEYECR